MSVQLLVMLVLLPVMWVVVVDGGDNKAFMPGGIADFSKFSEKG